MKLYAKKNGAGYITTYQVVFGCREAKDLQLIDKNGNVKEIEKAEVLDNNIIQIKLVERINDNNINGGYKWKNLK